MENAEVLKQYAIALDVSRSISNREFTVVEGDTGNVLVVTLTDDGTAVDLSDCRVIAAFSKSNGTAAQDSNETDGGITIGGDSGNEVTIELFTGSFAPGMVECELQVYSGAEQKTLVTSAKFNFKCRRGILNEDVVMSTPEYPFLVQLIDECEAICDAESARVVSENGRVAAEADREELYDTVYNAYINGDFKGEKGDTAGNSVLSGADTDMTGILKGNGVNVVTAVGGVDYNPAPLVKTDVAATFTADTTYAGYGFKSEIAFIGATADMRPEVVFSVADAVSGNYAPVALSGTDTVTVYSKSGAATLIPTIVLWR